MASKVGNLIKEARTAAGLTQEKLAKKVGGGLTAADISKAEHGEADLSVAVLRKIAKATGVTQASLVNAAKPTTTANSTTATTSAAKSTLRVTATEKRLVEAYRSADSDTKKAAMNVLRGKCSDLLPSLLSSATSDEASGSVADMISDALGSLLGKQS